MKTVRVHQYGGLEALKVEDVPVADPGEGEARVKLEAIGVNFIDIYHRIGRYQGSLPLTLGQEAAGTVESVGANVTDVGPGDRVAYASVQGAYAEYAIVPAWRLVPIPAGVDAPQAAAAMI
jgi:NADPH2:quinone reductase